MLRDWTGSEKVNSLSVHAERFFTRLIMKADDYGCCYADERLLKANLFPFLINAIREADLLRWMAECQKAGLIVIYEHKGKKYLQIIEFGQRLRQKTNKFPLPEHDSTLPPIDRTLPHEENRSRREEEVEVKEVADKPHTYTHDQLKLFEDFKTWIKDKAPRVDQMKEPLTIEQYFKLKEKYSRVVITNVLIAMQNRANLLKTYVSAYLTINNWAQRDNGAPNNTQETPSFAKQAAEAVKEIENGINRF
jgi:hypothetical protein